MASVSPLKVNVKLCLLIMIEFGIIWITIQDRNTLKIGKVWPFLVYLGRNHD